MNKRFFIVAVVAVLLLAVSGLFLLKQGVQFNSETWKNKAFVYNGDDLRAQMIDSLLEQKLLVGKSKSDIVELLGDPDTDSEGKNLDDYYYFLENEFMGVDGIFLHLSFKNGVVSIVDIVGKY